MWSKNIQLVMNRELGFRLTFKNHCNFTFFYNFLVLKDFDWKILKLQSLIWTKNECSVEFVTIFDKWPSSRLVRRIRRVGRFKFHKYLLPVIVAKLFHLPFIIKVWTLQMTCFTTSLIYLLTHIPNYVSVYFSKFFLNWI